MRHYQMAPACVSSHLGRHGLSGQIYLLVMLEGMLYFTIHLIVSGNFFFRS